MRPAPISFSEARTFVSFVRFTPDNPGSDKPETQFVIQVISGTGFSRTKLNNEAIIRVNVIREIILIV